MIYVLPLISSLLVMAVTDGQYVGGSDIDDMAGFVVGFLHGRGVPRSVGGSNLDILLGGTYFSSSSSSSVRVGGAWLSDGS
eukprot:CAMPEP_0202032478 /NCGR_PEP_ID=MMETSP0905-20130828/65549_1 /ASSEMBLY_ACC=CAM_ASM_000554 /TAXON_ID=420261 /ORGANISM="Thalassiosira antarctica, Strain CCMP982" /LENGTH=80 /DNA_ID=CAMNT_0048596339 /DNA_START=24 /DNA_END=266 /DNA_ORIENTATION=+